MILHKKIVLALLCVAMHLGVAASIPAAVTPILNGGFETDHVNGTFSPNWYRLGGPSGTSGWNANTSDFALNSDRYGGRWVSFVDTGPFVYDLNTNITSPSDLTFRFEQGIPGTGDPSALAPNNTLRVTLTVGATPYIQDFSYANTNSAGVLVPRTAVFDNITATGSAVLSFSTFAGAGFLDNVSDVAIGTQVNSVAVTDGSFESVPNNIGGWSYINQAAWSPAGGTSQFQQNHEGDHFGQAADGEWYAYLPNSGKITQDLLTNVQAGDTLMIQFAGGNSGPAQTTGGGIFNATFTVGGTDYTSSFDTTTLPQNQWGNFTLIKTITNSGNLKLSFEATSGQPWLDNISAITITTLVPEPASVALLASAGALIFFLGRQRRRVK